MLTLTGTLTPHEGLYEQHHLFPCKVHHHFFSKLLLIIVVLAHLTKQLHHLQA